LVVSGLNRKILFLCAVAAGSAHDYALMKNAFEPGLAWFGKAKVWLDLGFLGADKGYPGARIRLPHKKPRKSKKNPGPALTTRQKNQNRRQAATRVAVEHAIGGMKAFHCLLHRIRNHLDGFVDHFFALSAGLWNYKIA
jgi:hypothetical protein